MVKATSEALIDSLICKNLSVVGIASGRDIADHLCLPMGVVEDLYYRLRSRQYLPLEMRREHFDRLVRSYFTVVLKGETAARRPVCVTQAVN